MSLSLNLEEEISAKLSQEIKESIDCAIALEMFRQSGWHYVEISRFADNNHAVDITHWLEEFIEKGMYYRAGREFVFKKDIDCTMFTLKWCV